MNLTISAIQILQPHQQLQVRFEKTITDPETGEAHSLGYHRQVFAPGDDLSGQPQQITDLAAWLWSPAPG